MRRWALVILAAACLLSAAAVAAGWARGRSTADTFAVVLRNGCGLTVRSAGSTITVVVDRRATDPATDPAVWWVASHVAGDHRPTTPLGIAPLSGYTPPLWQLGRDTLGLSHGLDRIPPVRVGDLRAARQRAAQARAALAALGPAASTNERDLTLLTVKLADAQTRLAELFVEDLRYAWWRASVPDALACPLLAAAAAWLGRRRWRQAAAGVGHCAACGYDLLATPDRCPECGAVPVPGRSTPVA